MFTPCFDQLTLCAYNGHFLCINYSISYLHNHFDRWLSYAFPLLLFWVSPLFSGISQSRFSWTAL